MSILDTAGAAIRRLQRRRSQAAIGKEIQASVARGEVATPSEYLERAIQQQCGISRDEGEADRHYLARALGITEAQLQEYHDRKQAGEEDRKAQAVLVKE